MDKVTPFPLWANDPEAEELRQRDRQERAERARANAPCAVSANAPLDAARAFITASHMAGNHRSLIFHRDSFYSWSGTSYPELAAGDLRACLYDFLDRCVTIDSNGKPIPFKPNRSRVLEALAAATNVSSQVEPPAWLRTQQCDSDDVIACQNGLLNIKNFTLLPHTPTFFNLNALEFPFDPAAPAPTAWLKFLDQLWGADQQSIETLQEIFGLALTTDTRHQKAFLLVGPKRSGKGTIARILTALVGRANVVSPTLGSLGDRFGLAPLIGKLVAIISDARLGAKADQHAIAESILRITGEDDVTVDRKNRDVWTGRLRVRFLVVSNELPRLADVSGALSSRFVILQLMNSFYGREDQGLTERLTQELPGILNWAIVGLRRLRARGYFVQPASAAEAVQELEDLASPISTFLRQCCVIGPEYMIGIERLYEAWRKWCEEQGREHPGTSATFGRDLKAAVPNVTKTRPRDGDERLWCYQGLKLR